MTIQSKCTEHYKKVFSAKLRRILREEKKYFQNEHKNILQSFSSGMKPTFFDFLLLKF